MLPQLVCGRDRHRADLVQRHHRGPELIVPLEHQHDLVSLAYSH